MRTRAWRHARVLALVAACCWVLTGCHLFGGAPVIVTTPGFLGPADFAGSYDKLGYPVFMGGQSSFDGEIVFTNLPRTVVEDVLPTDLQLATNTAQPTKHPVILAFGLQHNLKWVFPGGWSIGLDKEYNELMVIIPFVQKQGKQKWHNYVMRMYLDWPWAINTGNTYFGFRKEEAAFLRAVLPSPADYELSLTKNDASLWNGKVTGLAAWMDNTSAKASLANYAAMREIFKMPMLGTLSLAIGDPYVCSFFDWRLADSQLRRSEVDYRFQANFVPNMAAWVAAGVLTNTDDGGFGVKRLQWRMTSPLPCRF